MKIKTEVGAGLLEQRQQQPGFEMLRHREERVGDGVRRAAEPQGDALGVRERLLGKLLDLFREGRRKEHRLPARRDVLENALDRGQEAHVEHAVAFIQDENFHVVQPGVTLLDQVQQAARAGDQDLDPVLQGFDLRTGADTAVNGGAAQARPRPEHADVIVDLLGQLAGGGDDQRTRLVARAVEQFMQNG